TAGELRTPGRGMQRLGEIQVPQRGVVSVVRGLSGQEQLPRGEHGLGAVQVDALLVHLEGDGLGHRVLALRRALARPLPIIPAALTSGNTLRETPAPNGCTPRRPSAARSSSL